MSGAKTSKIVQQGFNLSTLYLENKERINRFLFFIDEASRDKVNVLSDKKYSDVLFMLAIFGLPEINSKTLKF